MLYPDELRYLDSHQWVKVEQDRGTIGITQYGQEKMGEVIEVNEKLRDNPSLINSDPYGEGWLIKIRLFNLSEVESLLTSLEYEKVIEKG
ncbi:hypothetical protein J7K97_04715 [Candidatus Aerophobetes bacterium]|nr:hypothetical protein [Candidatus Aerophobetes bacterium]